MSRTSCPNVSVQDTHGCSTTCQDQGVQMSFHEGQLRSSLDALSHASALQGQEASWNPWLLEMNTYASPVTPNPSFTGSEVFPTPPAPYEVPAVYDFMSQQALPVGDMMNQVNWAPGPDQVWSGQPQESNHTWSASTPMSSWSEDFAPPTVENLNQPQLVLFTQNGGLLSLTPPSSSCEGESGGSDSDSDSDDSSYTAGSSMNRGIGSSTGSGNNRNGAVLRLGRWSVSNDLYTQPEQRNYGCIYANRPDPYGRYCTKRFVRPEHCRRHVKTVHGEARDHVCKVPQCRRAFSRGDNLRDHYWTHISRGGRAGKNDKMSIGDLKSILGSRDKKLLRKLKDRLTEQQIQKGKAKSKL